MEFQALLDELSNICTVVATGDDNVEQLDHKKVWEVLFKVGSNDIRNTTLLYPMINIYSARFPSFRDVIPVIDNYVKDLLDSSKSFDERSKNSTAIFRWLPYYHHSLISKVIVAAIDITYQYINEKNDVPVDFLLPLNDSEISEIPPEDLKGIFEQIKGFCLEGEKRFAALCVWATICHGIADVEQEAGQFNAEIVKVFLSQENNNEKELLSGAYYLLFASEAFQDEPENCPEAEDIYNMLRRLIVHTNENIRRRSLKAFRKLIQTHIFLTEGIVKKFLEIYNEFSNHKSDYFKVISNFILPDDTDGENEEEEEENEADLSIIQPIVDFVTEHLNDSSDKETQGLCLDACSDLGFKDSLFIEDLVDTGLDVSHKLIEAKEYITYPYIANYLTSLNEKFREQTGEKILEFLPTLVSSLENEATGVLKQRIYCAGALAQLLSSEIMNENNRKELIPSVVDFIINNIDKKDQLVDFNMCAVILPLIPFIGEAKSNTIFAAFVEDLKNTEDEEHLAAWLSVCVKIIKKYTVNEDILNSIVALIMSGELKIFHGTPPHMTMPPLRAPFMLLRSFVKKNPSKASPICQQIIEWLKYTPFSSAPILLLPLTAGLEAGCLNEESADEFAKVLRTFLGRLDMGDTDELIAVCNTLNSLFNVFPNKMTPIVDFLKPLENFAKSCIDMEGEDDLIDDEMIEAMPSVADFAFHIYANDDNVEVLPDLINPLLELLPFQPQVEEVSGILENLMTMLEDTERFGEILVPALRALTDILLMKKSDLEEFNFDDDLMKNMKQTLKTCCKGNKRLIDQVTVDIKKNRAKLNRFNILIR
ncbi:hypothetical protein TRFO_36709 [Tritrichomonas foetus]|uniref:TOG domain-containing protein n=1 Tax=Tritrichomonas foetus TaxID=1144522 RepID=A0A1J4JFT5_9EUKA|nr:hypothetical protein TRFO_36709 [Tritrichomonas foetus]|eukprot:OHS97151.1 hypothetical protein TRFO_36709 [Tritrichomonas foetus]